MRCLDDGWVRVRPHVLEGEGSGVIGGRVVQGPSICSQSAAGTSSPTWGLGRDTKYQAQPSQLSQALWVGPSSCVRFKAPSQ